MLGIAPESRADRAAHYVAKSLQDNGVKIVPVPVYYFDIQVPHLLLRSIEPGMAC